MPLAKFVSPSIPSEKSLPKTGSQTTRGRRRLYLAIVLPLLAASAGPTLPECTFPTPGGAVRKFAAVYLA